MATYDSRNGIVLSKGKQVTQFKVGDVIRDPGNKSPGAGWASAGNYSYQTNNPRSGSTKNQGTLWRYDGPSQPADKAAAPQQTAARSSANNLPNPNDGQYGNITANIQHQANAGAAEAAYWQKQQPAAVPAPPTITAPATAPAAPAGPSNEQILQSLLIQQQQAFQQQALLQQQQLATAEATAKEQARQAEALGRAYVPQLQATATAPMLGDTRQAEAGASNRSLLSSLAILTGPRTTSPSLVGLQIA